MAIPRASKERYFEVVYDDLAADPEVGPAWVGERWGGARGIYALTWSRDSGLMKTSDYLALMAEFEAAKGQALDVNYTPAPGSGSPVSVGFLDRAIRARLVMPGRWALELRLITTDTV